RFSRDWSSDVCSSDLAITQQVAVGVLYHKSGFGSVAFPGLPFMATLRADEHPAVFVGVYGIAAGAGRQTTHVKTLFDWRSQALRQQERMRNKPVPEPHTQHRQRERGGM